MMDLKEFGGKIIIEHEDEFIYDVLKTRKTKLDPMLNRWM